MINIQGVTKTIVVDARCFDLDAKDSEGDFQDAYIARFLNEAMDDGFTVHILYDPYRYKELENALKLAVDCCMNYIGDDVDFERLKGTLLSAREYHKIHQDDLVKEDEYDALVDDLDPIGIARLVLSPKEEFIFGPQIGNYVSYRKPSQLSSTNAFEEFKAEQEADAEMREHIVASACDSASRQIAMIEDTIVFHRELGPDHEKKLSDIGKNKIIYDFCNRHPIEVETPSEENPSISMAEFCLTHYFANLLRAQHDNLSIGEEEALEAENTDLIIAITEMEGGDAAIHEIREYAQYFASLRPTQ